MIQYAIQMLKNIIDILSYILDIISLLCYTLIIKRKEVFTVEINKYWFAGLFVGLLLTAIAVMAAKKKTIKEFDERQNILRGNAFRRAFFTVLAAAAVYTSAVLFLGRPLMEDGVSTMVIVCIGTCVFGVDCIIHDAFFTVKEKPWPYMMVSGGVALLNGLNGIDMLREGKLVRNGLVTIQILTLLLAAMFLVLFLAVLIKGYVIKGDAE